MKIKISTSIGSVEIEAVELKIKRAKGFRFFIHETYNGGGDSLSITEYSSGCVVVKGNAKKYMLTKLRNKLKRKTTKQIQEKIKETAKRFIVKYPVNT